jgi:hypothetical protein
MNAFAPALMVVALLFLGGCEKAEEVPVPKPAEPARSPSAGGSILSAPVDYVGTTVKAKQAAARTVDTVSLNQAIQLFHAQEGHFPKTLNELVAEKYIVRIPEAPSGMRLEYDPAKGQARMVSTR